MRVNTIKSVSISALSLGTVQLGLDYGISNQGGKPDQEQAFALLDRAIALGVNTLDTAAAYGDSELVIGQWLKTVPAEKHPFIVTKATELDHSSVTALRASLKEQAVQSKRRLGLEQLPVLMLHSCEEYLDDAEHVAQVFRELKDAGEIRFCGVSAYSHHDYGRIADSGFDAVQIPINIFDQKQVESGGIARLTASGMMVFARSIYLQGLVFQRPETLVPRMAFARETLQKFLDLCEKYGLSPAHLALSYALSLPGVTSLVLGSEKPEQVEQNVELVSSAAELAPEQMEEILETFRDTPKRVLFPRLWEENNS